MKAVATLDRDAILQQLQARVGPPATARDLARQLGIPREAQASFRRLLRALAAEGLLAMTRGPRFAAATAAESADAPANPSAEPVVAPRRGAIARRSPGGQRTPAGQRTRRDPHHPIHEPRHPIVVGRLERDRRGNVRVQPFDARVTPPIHVRLDARLAARDGDMVSVELTRRAGPGREAAGRIVEVLGAVGDAGVDTAVIVRKHGIPDAHSPAALAEAHRIATAAIAERDLAGRTDFRGDAVVTIDGEHARDFDDAVSVTRLANGRLRLAVHIADVGHYVREGSALDLEALDRGTSVYFPDRAVHMFPEALATGLCSLRPGVDRLVQSCVMDVDANGAVVRHELHDGVIHSRARMTYTDLNAIVTDRDPKLRTAYLDLVPMFDLLRELFDILNARRRRRGSIDFDLPEAEVVLDPDGDIADIVAGERNVAHRIVEECMLLANETVAAHLEEHDMPALYRIHEPPEDGRVAEFEAFLEPLGLQLAAGADVLHPRHFQQLIDRIRGAAEERPVAAQMLRTMQKARYDAANLGHFGLAAHTYTHFTSPIRRYPDLVVHRVVRELRHGRADARRRDQLAESLPEIARHTSAMERRAQDAERELLQWKKVRFMADKVGETFDGHVTGVAPFGLFVQLDEHFVEGLLHMAALTDDDYRFDANARVIYGTASRRVFRLGHPVRVQVARVDQERRQIELALEGVDARAARSRRRPPPGRRTAARDASPAPRRRIRGRPGRRERATRKKGRR
jgi:ribonuclease R